MSKLLPTSLCPNGFVEQNLPWSQAVPARVVAPATEQRVLVSEAVISYIFAPLHGNLHSEPPCQHKWAENRRYNDHMTLARLQRCLHAPVGPGWIFLVGRFRWFMIRSSHDTSVSVQLLHTISHMYSSFPSSATLTLLVLSSFLNKKKSRWSV